MSLSEFWLRSVFDLIEKEASYNWNIPHTTVFLPGRMTCYKTDIRGRLRKGSARPSLKVLSAGHVYKEMAHVPKEFGSPITAITVEVQDEGVKMTFHDAQSITNFWSGSTHTSGIAQRFDSVSDALLVQTMWTPYWCKMQMQRVPTRLKDEGLARTVLLDRMLSFQSTMGEPLRVRVTAIVERVVDCILNQNPGLKLRRLDLFFLVADADILLLFCAGAVTGEQNLLVHSNDDAINLAVAKEQALGTVPEGPELRTRRRKGRSEKAMCPSCLNICLKSRRYKVKAELIMQFFDSLPFQEALRRIHRRELDGKSMRPPAESPDSDETQGPVTLTKDEVRARAERAARIALRCSTADGLSKLAGVRAALVEEEAPKLDPVRFVPGELSPPVATVYEMLRVSAMQQGSKGWQEPNFDPLQGEPYKMGPKHVKLPLSRNSFRIKRHGDAEFLNEQILVCEECCIHYAEAKSRKMESHMRQSLVLPIGNAPHTHDYADLAPLEKAAAAYLHGSQTERAPIVREPSTPSKASPRSSKSGTPSTPGAARTPSSSRRHRSVIEKINSGASLHNVVLLPQERGFDPLPRHSHSPLRRK